MEDQVKARKAELVEMLTRQREQTRQLEQQLVLARQAEFQMQGALLLCDELLQATTTSTTMPVKE